MAISLQSYRMTIGLFNNRGRHISVKISENKVYSSKPRYIFIVSLLLSIIHSSGIEVGISNPPLFQKNSAMSCRIQTLPCDIINPPTAFIGWSQCQKINSLCRSLFGNKRRLGYTFALWNCRKGLLSDGDFDSTKLTDVKHFIQKHSPHSLGIVESDIHSKNSRLQRKSNFNISEVKTKLEIDGYKLELPDTWACHGQARVILYTEDRASTTGTP